jgi:hypothetical protein
MSTLNFKFSELKKIISIEKNKAKKKVQKDYPVLISRGNEFSSYINNESVEDGDKLTFNTKKELMELFNDAMSKGVTTIFVEGDFDGFESVHEVKQGTSANMISDWSIEFWNNKDGFCFKPLNRTNKTPKTLNVKKSQIKMQSNALHSELYPTNTVVLKTETFYTKDHEEFFCVIEEIRKLNNERIFKCEELITGRIAEFSESTIIDLISDNGK